MIVDLSFSIIQQLLQVKCSLFIFVSDHEFKTQTCQHLNMDSNQSSSSPGPEASPLSLLSLQGAFVLSPLAFFR